jgi:type VI secretion system secreted protein Hcp
MSELSLSTDYYLKIEGIEGESQVVGHAQEIQMFSWGFGVTQTGTAELGSGMSSSGRANFQDFQFNKLMDKASPKLCLALCTGEVFDKAWLYARRIGQKSAKPLDYMVVEFEKVVISSYHFAGAGEGGVPQESLSFTFAKVSFNYREIKDGQPQGPVSGRFDLKLSKAF